METKKLLELKRNLQIEKDAKNQAYHFILAYGLLELFADFCKENKGKNHHAECLRIILSRIEQQGE